MQQAPDARRRSGPAGTVRAVALAPVLSDIRDPPHRRARTVRPPRNAATPRLWKPASRVVGGGSRSAPGGETGLLHARQLHALPQTRQVTRHNCIQAGRTSRHGRACAWRSCCGNASRYRSALTCCSRRSTEMGGCRPCPGQLLLGDHARAGAARADAARARHERRAAAGRVRRSAALRLEEQLGFKMAKYVCRLTRSTTTARSVPSRQLAPTISNYSPSRRSSPDYSQRVVAGGEHPPPRFARMARCQPEADPMRPFPHPAADLEQP